VPSFSARATVRSRKDLSVWSGFFGPWAFVDSSILPEFLLSHLALSCAEGFSDCLLRAAISSPKGWFHDSCFLACSLFSFHSQSAL